MLYFKKEGFSIYDLGGYQVEETQDSSLLQINSFKDGFRGELVQQNHYESYTFSLLKSGYKVIQTFCNK
jgi:lipid II:glycine glycyltransferase (peptidoglycan interpeptide bridge formation enzyme)